MAKAPAKKSDKKDAESGTSNQQPAQPILQVRTQYVKDLSFESPSAPQAFLEGGEAPQLDLGVNVNGEKIDDTHFELVLTIKATAKIEEFGGWDAKLTELGGAEVDINYLQTGDIVKIRDRETLGVFQATRIIVLTDEGFTERSLSFAEKAWRFSNG